MSTPAVLAFLTSDYAKSREDNCASSKSVDAQYLSVGETFLVLSTESRVDKTWMVGVVESPQDVCPDWVDRLQRGYVYATLTDAASKTVFDGWVARCSIAPICEDEYNAVQTRIMGPGFDFSASDPEVHPFPECLKAAERINLARALSEPQITAYECVCGSTDVEVTTTQVQTGFPYLDSTHEPPLRLFTSLVSRSAVFHCQSCGKSEQVPLRNIHDWQ